MKKMILIFSHKLSKEQIEDAKNNWHIDEFVPLPKHLQKMWSEINPDLQNLNIILKPIKEFLQITLIEDDLVLVQGDFGASFIVVNFVKSLGGVCVYATTAREVFEVLEDGQTVKKSVFKHRRFREYE